MFFGPLGAGGVQRKGQRATLGDGRPARHHILRCFRLQMGEMIYCPCVGRMVSEGLRSWAGLVIIIIIITFYSPWGPHRP